MDTLGGVGVFVLCFSIVFLYCALWTVKVSSYAAASNQGTTPSKIAEDPLPSNLGTEP